MLKPDAARTRLLEPDVAQNSDLCSSPSVDEVLSALWARAREVFSSDEWAWLKSRVYGVTEGREQQLFVLFSAAGRKMGRRPIGTIGAGLNSSHWMGEDLARVLGLLTAATYLDGSRHKPLVEDLYYRGSIQEKRAVLLALPKMPSPCSWLELAVDACRTNTVSVFESISCENPYPANHFTEPQMNQMILKALFMGLDVQRIEELPRRITERLRRDLRDYESERRAAGRSVPEGLHWILEKAEQDETL